MIVASFRIDFCSRWKPPVLCNLQRLYKQRSKSCRTRLLLYAKNCHIIKTYSVFHSFVRVWTILFSVVLNTLYVFLLDRNKQNERKKERTRSGSGFERIRSKTESFCLLYSPAIFLTRSPCVCSFIQTFQFQLCAS